MEHVKSTQIPVLIEEDTVAVTDINKANILGKVLEKVHRIELGEEYELRRDILDKNLDIMKKRNSNNSCMDSEFTITELKTALQKCANTAPGCDRISYIMIKHLSDSVLLMILKLYNKIWIEGILPKIWKRAVVIPIVKPGKNPTNPGSYRPIALTSNLCKLMEKIIVHRLSYELEKKGKVCKYRCGFRGKRSTMDALIKISNEIEKAIKMKEIMAVVYFDIEKAYDTIWREGLLVKASRIGIDGKMYNWLTQFLFERTFMVQVGACQSSVFKAENGIPQGSVISPVLFNIMINDIFDNLGYGVGCALYADDGAIWKRGRNVSQVISSMQLTIKKVEKWSIEWSFKMSTNKSCYMLFSRKK